MLLAAAPPNEQPWEQVAEAVMAAAKTPQFLEPKPEACAIERLKAAGLRWGLGGLWAVAWVTPVE